MISKSSLNKITVMDIQCGQTDYESWSPWQEMNFMQEFSKYVKKKKTPKQNRSSNERFIIVKRERNEMNGAI